MFLASSEGSSKICGGKVNKLMSARANEKNQLSAFVSSFTKRRGP